MSTPCILHLRVGAELSPEPWSDAACTEALEQAAASGCLDGALELGTPEAPLCRPDFWDQLDGLLLAWLEALDRLDAGDRAAVVRFPDTRIEAELERSDALIRVSYEDIDTSIDAAALRTALDTAAQRLVTALGTMTPALTALSERYARREA
ncbi:MAG: hypothetical protein H6747_10035 [Deltaproteobacteria bacterium]|nr:hypothetical protein [Deltaproteobacteria bacterium]